MRFPSTAGAGMAGSGIVIPFADENFAGLLDT